MVFQKCVESELWLTADQHLSVVDCVRCDRLRSGSVFVVLLE